MTGQPAPGHRQRDRHRPPPAAVDTRSTELADLLSAVTYSPGMASGGVHISCRGSSSTTVYMKDPLLDVGWLRCTQCGALAWPVDAANLSGHLTLVRFVIDRCRCTNTPATQVWLVDTDVRSEPVGPWCHALTVDGAPCRGRRRHGEATCWAHRLVADGGDGG